MPTEPIYKALVLFEPGPDRGSFLEGLKACGFEVDLVETLKEAAEALDTTDLELCAVHSTALPPGPDAFELLRPFAADVYVLVVCPPDRTEEGARLIGEGAKGVIPWPHPGVLLRSVLETIRSRLELERRQVRRVDGEELWEIAKALTSGMGPDQILEKIMDSAIRVTRADSGSIMLLDETKQRMAIAASRGIPPEVVQRTSVRIGEGISGRVALNGQPLLLRDGTEVYARLRDRLRRESIRSSLCVPIKSLQGDIMGTLSLNNERKVRNFAERDLHLMTLYAAEAGAVIQGARGLEALQRTHRNLRRSHERLKATQAQLVQSAKMAAVGMLASGVAHEFNNLLTGILGMAQLARETGKERHVQKAIEVAISNSEKARVVVTNLLRFSSQYKKVREPFDLASLADETLSLVARDLERSNVEVVRDYAQAPSIRANRGEIQQVLLNLFINARQAMEAGGGGRLTVSIQPSGADVRVAVSDTGCGIPEENKSRIFEPFFSTKSLLGGSGTAQGTGLGLSVSYGIVKGHGGRIRFESEAGRGTTFLVDLPLNPPKGKAYTDRIPRKESRTRSMTPLLPVPPGGPVLVIDDEWWVRDFLSEALGEAGMEVLTAEGGEAGLKVLAERKPPVVFLDVLMPGAPGADTAERILRESPGVRLVLMSGRLESLDSIEKILESGIHAYLRKPFEVQDVYNVLGIAPEEDAAEEGPDGGGGPAPGSGPAEPGGAASAG